MNTLTFNASDWSGDIVTATVSDLGHGESRVIFRGEQFEISQYESDYGSETLYKLCDLTWEGRLIATAIQDGKTWYASEREGDISRCGKDPVVALLQVAANII